MPEVFCSCGKRFLAKPEHLGRWAQCPKCGQRFVIQTRLAQEELIVVDPPFPIVIQEEPLRKKPPESRDISQVFYRNQAVVIGTAVALLTLACLFGYLIRPIADLQRAKIVAESRDTPTENVETTEAARNLHELELEARKLRGENDRQRAAAVGKVLVAENERLRQEWLASGKSEKTGDMAYLVDHLSQAMITQQNELLEFARKGNPKPTPDSDMGKLLALYADPTSDTYMEAFARILRGIAPKWFEE
jgi:hypothetical protein